MRIHAILGLLDGTPAGLTVREIRARVLERGYDVGERTIYRDIAALSAAGFPVIEEKPTEVGEGARFRLDGSARVANYLVLTFQEAFCLYLARGALQPLKGTVFYDDLDRLFTKIEERIGKPAQSYLKELATEVRFEPGPRWGLSSNPDIIESIRNACAEGQVVEIDYSSASSANRSMRKVGPHYLYFAKGALYLLGEDLADRKTKVFSVARIHQALMLPDSYDGPKLEPDEHFRSSFGVYHGAVPVEVKIHFSPKIGPFARERTWHSSQRVAANADGSIVMSLDVAITPELVNWILGFGAGAQVLAPVELCEAVLSEAGSILGRYPGRRAA